MYDAIFLSELIMLIYCFVEFETFEILLTILTYANGFHKYICTCYQIQLNIDIKQIHLDDSSVLTWGNAEQRDVQ